MQELDYEQQQIHEQIVGNISGTQGGYHSNWNSQLVNSVREIAALAESNPDISEHLLSPSFMAANVQALASFRTTSVLAATAIQLRDDLRRIEMHFVPTNYESIGACIRDMKNKYLVHNNDSNSSPNGLKDVSAALMSVQNSIYTTGTSSHSVLQEIKKSIESLSNSLTV